MAKVELKQPIVQAIAEDVKAKPDFCPDTPFFHCVFLLRMFGYIQMIPYLRPRFCKSFPDSASPGSFAGGRSGIGGGGAALAQLCAAEQIAHPGRIRTSGPEAQDEVGQGRLVRGGFRSIQLG